MGLRVFICPGWRYLTWRPLSLNCVYMSCDCTALHERSPSSLVLVFPLPSLASECAACNLNTCTGMQAGKTRDIFACPPIRSTRKALWSLQHAACARKLTWSAGLGWSAWLNLSTHGHKPPLTPCSCRSHSILCWSATDTPMRRWGVLRVWIQSLVCTTYSFIVCTRVFQFAFWGAHCLIKFVNVVKSS